MLLLGLYKRIFKSGVERVSVTNPLPTTLLTEDDILIVLARSEKYYQRQQDIEKELSLKEKVKT